jgi:transcriptional regulator with XRE-family HTH domain
MYEKRKRLISPERLLAKRAEARLTQRQLAAKAGVSHNFVSALERGRCGVSVDNLHQLAEALDCLPSELLNPELAAA